MHGVTLSADGRYIAFLSGAEDDTVLMTFDRTQVGSEFKRVTASEPGKFDLGWCRWANQKRLICGVYGNIRGKKYAEPPVHAAVRGRRRWRGAQGPRAVAQRGQPVRCDHQHAQLRHELWRRNRKEHGVRTRRA